MENGWKILIAAALAALGAYLRQLAVPLAVLLTVMVLDYISGMIAAIRTGTLDSRIGLMGILKKVSYLLIVAVGMVLDYLIQMLGGEFGVQLEGTYIVGLLVIFWLIINECISILENVDEAGGPVPPFVAAMLKRLKRHTEDIAGETEDENAEN
ncbi:MAG: phage holin family protein [Oscillospiraceae bacterium]|nr:phage holin family protein [Oscillospiraceae bacterium]